METIISAILIIATVAIILMFAIWSLATKRN